MCPPPRSDSAQGPTQAAPKVSTEVSARMSAWCHTAQSTPSPHPSAIAGPSRSGQRSPLSRWRTGQGSRRVFLQIARQGWTLRRWLAVALVPACMAAHAASPLSGQPVRPSLPVPAARVAQLLSGKDAVAACGRDERALPWALGADGGQAPSPAAAALGARTCAAVGGAVGGAVDGAAVRAVGRSATAGGIPSGPGPSEPSSGLTLVLGAAVLALMRGRRHQSRNG